MINVVTALRVGSQIRLRNGKCLIDLKNYHSKGINEESRALTTPLPEVFISLLIKLKGINKPKQMMNIYF